MFEEFIKIPHAYEDAVTTYGQFRTIRERLQAVTVSDKYKIRWRNNYYLTDLAYILTMLTSLSIKDDNKFKIEYWKNDAYRFQNQIDAQDITYGIMINEEASTHYESVKYVNGTFLENAQNFMKQSPHHFLKIFMMPNDRKLYVWTNKELSPDTLYKLFALEASLNPRDNEIASNFINALIEDNIETARNVLIDFMSSDIIREIEFERFRKCLSNRLTLRIRDLERKIANNRSTINDYESQIAIMASQMREWNENIAFIKSTDDKEEQKLFYKHLCKVPYIKKFDPAPDENAIILYYEAPITYFSDYPAEKLLESTYRTNEAKAIIKIFLGRKYELWTKCAIKFDTTYFSIETARLEDTSNPELLPHPHIVRFNCFGNHRQAIAEAAESGNYIGAIEQTTQAVLNLNFYDTCVIDTLVEALECRSASLHTWKCVETGEMLTTNEVIERGDYYEEA